MTRVALALDGTREARALRVEDLPLRSRLTHAGAERLLALQPVPDVAVEVDVVLTSGAQVRSRHLLHGDRVTALSSGGGEVEVARLGVRWWQTELARAATVPPDLPGRTPVDPPAQRLRLPHELLLGAGQALRTDRPDVLAALLGRHAGEVGGDLGAVATGGVREQVVRLHAASLGRLRAVVTGPRTGAVGWVSWMLFADGWRRLEPYVCGTTRTAMVRVSPARPGELGVDVAHLARAVR